MVMKKLVGLVALAAIAFGGTYVYLNFFRGSDAKLIKDALAESIKASKEGRPGSVMDLLSDKLKVNDQDTGPRRQIAEFIKNSRPDITVKDVEPVINPTNGTAKITSSVHLKVGAFGQNIDTDIPNVTLTFRREDGTQWLLFPVKQWKLSDVSVPIDSLPAGLSALGS